MDNDTQTLTLTEFLLARIAEDEQIATSANPSVEWQLENDFGGFSDFAPDGTVVASRDRVLAECEAKRRIIGEVETLRGVIPAHVQGDGDEHEAVIAEWCDGTVLPLLALPYADHPDFDDAWRL